MVSITVRINSRICCAASLWSCLLVLAFLVLAWKVYHPQTRLCLAQPSGQSLLAKSKVKRKGMNIGKGEELGPEKQSPQSSSMCAQGMCQCLFGLGQVIHGIE